ncbi:cytochrome P450 6A1 [Lindgomyces ingoldianus]|uniref:Cytochrome P450 6A1 n=1 Tax=Lindgomyces ingoldianus TaxID=673940 RepID=A0ACB6QCX3_9PLEO|nr:cytochrome P450 6A1 [Lindgomyces ingoldianus]KAF2464350.1 cytochrome P450 6A1 [Lindgomyces ingoldianus]
MALLDTLDRQTSSPIVLLLVSTTVLFTTYVLLHTYFRRVPSNAPPVVSENFPLTGAIAFWTRRWDFFRNARDHAAGGNFSFHAGPNTIIGLSGDKGRQLFFDSRDLGFGEGYAVLFGQSPQLKEHARDDGINQQDEYSNYFNRRLTYLLKNEQFRKKLPILKSDVQEALDRIRNEPSGITNPFDSIYRIVFRLTIRMVGADEIADDSKLLERTLKLFEMIDQSATATAVMFPKFPSPAILKRTYAGARLYMMMEDLVKKRQGGGEKHDDALQYLLDQGDRMSKIIEFVVGSLFAGLLNSGINAAWVLCYLATSPEWLVKAREEVQAVAVKYATNPKAPLRHQLDDVPLEAWETEFPIVDLCLRDSIRLNLLGTAFRKNISGKAIPTGNGHEVIPPNTFVTYATGDVHLDPTIYKDPEKWDPSRYLPDRAEDKKKTYGFLGWGVGRHPCLGMRFAKLEQNIITAYFLATFDFELLDKHHNKLLDPPRVNQNGHSAQKPRVPQFLRTVTREK